MASAGQEPDAQPDEHGRVLIAPGETLEIFRAVAVDTVNHPALVESFQSEAELAGRSEAEPGVERLDRADVEYEALSARERFDQVRDLIRNIAKNEQLPPYSPDLQVGNYIATLRLTADHGVRYRRDPPPQGHVSVWGDPGRLVAAVVDIQSAWD
jgi:hypothetical protein